MEETNIETVLTQAQFDEYARLSGDDNPIHVDPTFAAGTRFGRTVAHGMFLFAMLHAALARRHGGAVQLAAQEFIFRAPTYAGDPITLSLSPAAPDRIEETVTTGTGEVTVSGIALLGKPDRTDPAPPTLLDSEPYKGLEVGMTASRSRTFTAEDVAAYLDLVADPNPRFRGPHPELPPALLGGMASWVLGVDLPGRGTNWLKQRFTYHRSATAPASITTTVTITRLRPEKGLVNLATRSVGDTGVLSSGETLALAVDVAPR
jgi:acyl dehydratase